MTRVLLADDHPMIGAALDVLLRGTDYELIGRARSGADALAQVQQLKPDLLLLDVNMPDGSGPRCPAQASRRTPRADGDAADRRHGRHAAARRRPARSRGHGAQDLRPGAAASTAWTTVRKGERWVDPEIAERLSHAKERAAASRRR